MDNTAGNNTNRVRDEAGIVLNSGALVYYGAPGAASTETFGVITINNAANENSTIVSANTPAALSRFTAPAFTNNNAGTSSTNFVDKGNRLKSATNRLKSPTPCRFIPSCFRNS